MNRAWEFAQRAHAELKQRKPDLDKVRLYLELELSEISELEQQIRVLTGDALAAVIVRTRPLAISQEATTGALQLGAGQASPHHKTKEF